MRSSRRVAAMLMGVGVLVGCGKSTPTEPSPPAPPSGPAIFVGAGDIADCALEGAGLTAALLDGVAGTVFTAGDNAYDNGTADEFHRCFDPTWGRHKSRIRPTPGNHDYNSAGATPYFAYFGGAAGEPGLGYYSFTVGTWHIVALNSNIAAGEGSAQLTWLQSDLAANAAACTAAIWHHPLYSSSQNGPQPMMRAAWTVLQRAGAEFVVSGHDHVYERFAPMDESGNPAIAGIRQFVVGTGGAKHYVFGPTLPNSEVRGVSWGVIRFTLNAGSYQWDFIPVSGSAFTDAGSASCH